MRNILFAAVALAALVSGTAAMADEFDGQQDHGNVSAYLDQQSTNSQVGDTTAPSSIRSHGRP